MPATQHLKKNRSRTIHGEADPPDVLAAKVETLRRELPQLIREAIRAEIGAARSPHDATEDPEPLLTKEDVAGRLNVSPRTVDTLAASGELPRLKIRGCVRFHPDAVDAFVRSRA